MHEYYSWRPFWMAVSGRNLLIANDVSSTVSRYELPAVNWTSSGTLCPPRAAGGLLDNSTFWSTPSPETMNGPLRVVARAGQLAVGEVTKLKVWNNYMAKPFGAAPDFELPNLGNTFFAQFATDDIGYLWNGPAGAGTSSRRTTGPRHLPRVLWSGVPHWADDGTPIANFNSETVHHVVRPIIIVADFDHNRLLSV
jgi:hypothetical protein